MSGPASVRVSGPPNSSFLVGYPGISATLVCQFLRFLFLLTPLPHLALTLAQLAVRRASSC